MITREYKTWESASKMVYGLQSFRFNDFELFEVNSSDISLSSYFLLCVWFESLLNDTLATFLFFQLENHDHAHDVESIKDKMRKAQLKNYEDLFKNVIRKNLHDIVGNENWKGIKALYEIRNELMHGNPIVVKRGGVESFKLRKVESYLKEKELLQSTTSLSFLHPKSVSHFISVVENATIAITEVIMDFDFEDEFGIRTHSFSSDYKNFICYTLKSTNLR